MLDSLNVYGAIFFLSTFPCRFSKWNVWSTLSSCSTFQQHVNNYGCGRVNLHRQSKAAAGGGTHGAVRHLKHPPNCICRLVVKYLPLSCLIIAADSSDRGQKRSAAFELPLTSLSPYRLLSSTHDLALYIWQIYKPHTASKTGTPRLKGFVFFKEDSQCRKSTWCSSVVKSRIELGRSRSLQRCSLSPLKKKKKPSLERGRGRVYGVGALCMFLLCLCWDWRSEKASCWCWGGPAGEHSEISHTAVWGVLRPHWADRYCVQTPDMAFHHVAMESAQICVSPFVFVRACYVFKQKDPVNKMIYTRGGSFET